MVHIFQNIGVQNNASAHKISLAQNDPIKPFCIVASCATFYKGFSALQFVYFRYYKYCNKKFSKFSPVFLLVL